MAPPALLDPGCPLCADAGGRVLVRAGAWRIVLAGDPDHPAFTRVVWSAHVAEMSDLGEEQRGEIMRVVLEVERAQRDALAPDKINLASFGNVVPHLHWHVIPRWRDDRHFPEPVWGRPAAGRDEAVAARRAAVLGRLDTYIETLRRRLGGSADSGAGTIVA